jgi:acetyltransferase-like isoleucine patch superfamily enzyme
MAYNPYMVAVKLKPFRITILCIFALFPWAIKRRLLAILFGYKIDPSASIGISIVDSRTVIIGKHARIGHFTMCKGLDRLVLSEYARVGNLNWITGGSDRTLEGPKIKTKRDCALVLQEHSAITHRHYIDCSNSFSIGGFSTLAGVRSQVFTHSIDLSESRQKTQPVAIGAFCFVGTGSILLPGAFLPNYSVLGAGSVLRSGFDKEWSLYSGNPAIRVRGIPRDSAYFDRATGFVE